MWAAREKTKKADRETESSYAFSSRKRTLNDIASLIMLMKQVIAFVVVLFLCVSSKRTLMKLFCLKAPIIERNRIVTTRHPIRSFIE